VCIPLALCQLCITRCCKLFALLVHVCVVLNLVDPHIKVSGQKDAVLMAKTRIMDVLDTRVCNYYYYY